MFPFGEPVTRLRAPLVADDYSSHATRRDWSDATSVTMGGGFAIDPGTSTESHTVNREQVTTTPTLYGPSVDIVASDRVRDARGVVWEVTGNRSDWRSPFTGWQPGSSWPLQRVEG